MIGFSRVCPLHLPLQTPDPSSTGTRSLLQYEPRQMPFTVVSCPVSRWSFVSKR